MALPLGTRVGPYEAASPLGPDGRFVVIGDNSPQAEVLTVILGWFEELNRLVPVR